jgi:inner membrane protein
MSSFIGHSLPALSLHFSRQQQHQSSIYSSKYRNLWLIWLILVAWLPDIDHFVPALHASAHQGLRITHSIFVSLILPCCTVLILRLLKFKGRELGILSSQLILAALSHLVFDLLTGAMALPLLYPLSLQTYKLPFGLLPSAGRISLFNYYLYQNLFIEMGVLLPLFGGIHLMAHPPGNPAKKKIAIATLFGCSLYFMV